MKLATIFFAALFSGFSLLSTAMAQTPSPEPSKSVDVPQLEALMKKIDEQNAKIDALSQQILKLEQQVSAIHRGVIIGETPSAPSTSASTSEAPKATQSGNNHVVAKGETLTSIAKMHKVSVEELQKFNHIENDRKLQIGQTIMIPPPASSPGASPSPNG